MESAMEVAIQDICRDCNSEFRTLEETKEYLKYRLTEDHGFDLDISKDGRTWTVLNTAQELRVELYQGELAHVVVMTKEDVLLDALEMALAAHPSPEMVKDHDLRITLEYLYDVVSITKGEEPRYGQARP